MERIKGRYYGCCWECGHCYEWPVPSEEDGPLVRCIPKMELMAKYNMGCRFLIPKCEHNAADPADFKTEAAPEPVEATAE